MHGTGDVPVIALLGLVLTSFAAAEAPRPAKAESRPAQAVAIDITAKRFEFVPNVIEVVEGDQVTLAIKSADGTHGFEIKKLKVKKEIPKGGEVVTLSFTAPAPGDYEIACSEYCGRGHRDMKAKLVVKPRSQ
jgi:cytochrome c oxidase subunit 2